MRVWWDRSLLRFVQTNPTPSTGNKRIYSPEFTLQVMLEAPQSAVTRRGGHKAHLMP